MNDLNQDYCGREFDSRRVHHFKGVKMNVHLESIAAYKRMIKYFEKQISILETKVYNERCCWEYEKKRIQLPIANKKL